MKPGSKTRRSPGPLGAQRNEPSRPIHSRPRIGDVAAAAGVSLGTVSAVLNGNGRLSDSTRDRVKAAIDQLGYHPDLYASNLARRQTQLLGVLVSSLANPFFAETAQAIEDAAARRGFQISLMATNFCPRQHHAAVRQLLGARIAGLAVMTSEDDEASYRLITNSGVPSVFLDLGQPTGSSSVIHVTSDKGMGEAVQHLIELGHRQLLLVRTAQGAGGVPLLSHRLRYEGFQAAVRACGIEDLTVRVVEVEGSGAEAGERAIASVWGSEPFTAVIAVTDMIGMGIYRGLQARGVRIPEQVSVVGFDNTEFSRYLNPPLTTVDVPRSELACLVVDALVEKRERAERLVHLETRLVVRDSTAPPPAAVRIRSRRRAHATLS